MLRDYKSEDFNNANLFLIGERCFRCGHHIPVDQATKIGVAKHIWVHNSISICIALKRRDLQRLVNDDKHKGTQ